MLIEPGETVNAALAKLIKNNANKALMNNFCFIFVVIFELHWFINVSFLIILLEKLIDFIDDKIKASGKIENLEKLKIN